MLHDTYGFPLEVTQEIVEERGVGIDIEGFGVEMRAQRDRAKAARKAGAAGDDERIDAYREVVEQFGITEFLGYQVDETESRVLSIMETGADSAVEVFLDRTPFYAESGGQIGDAGTITTETGVITVSDCTNALPGLRRHIGRLTHGSVIAGQTATASIDVQRRGAIRRNHTGTHILHYALRKVLGEHVKQAGSMVGPDRLRFDFSHYAGVTDDEITEIETLANTAVLENDAVRSYETTKDEATGMGAIAFFGDKYGDIVRVLEAGRHSLELCGGTHVRATGDIGTIKIVSEGSIGSNLRRIEAVTGAASVALLQHDERVLNEAAKLVNARPDELIAGVQRKLDEIKALQGELKAMRAKLASGRATELAAGAVDGIVVARVDGLSSGDLRELAVAIRQTGVRRVILGGSTDSGERRSLLRSPRVPARPLTWSKRPAGRSRAAEVARATSPLPGARTRPASTKPCRSRAMPPAPRPEPSTVGTCAPSVSISAPSASASPSPTAAGRLRLH